MSEKKVSYLGKDIDFKGKMKLEEDFCCAAKVVDSEIESKKKFHIAKEGKVDGVIKAKSFSSEGSFKGKVDVDEFSLVKGSSFTGEIISDSIEIENKVHFNAQIKSKKQVKKTITKKSK